MGAMCKQQLNDMKDYTNPNKLGDKIDKAIKTKALAKAAENIEVDGATKFNFVYDATHYTGKNFGYDKNERTVEKLTSKY